MFGEILSELLSDEGYEPLRVATATRAHEFVVDQGPDLVVLLLGHATIHCRTAPVLVPRREVLQARGTRTPGPAEETSSA